MRAARVLVFALTAFAVHFGEVQSASADHCQWNADCLEVRNDEGRDEIVTEGVAFPGEPSDSPIGRASAEAAACPDCEWLIVPRCDSNDATNGAACRGAMSSCPEDGDVLYNVFLRRPPGAPQLVGTVCLGPGERPARVADIGEAVRERVVNLLPDAKPSFQPAQGGIVNLPTLFAANEPATMTTDTFDVLGVQVQVTATARWEWTFDDGVTQEFTKPGGPYPNDDVAYTYETTGARQVSVTTYWTAEYTVNGNGPFPVPGPEISKTAGPVTVPVREARSVLVGG